LSLEELSSVIIRYASLVPKVADGESDDRPMHAILIVTSNFVVSEDLRAATKVDSSAAASRRDAAAIRESLY
jgi:hypothetical protein